MSSHRKGQKNSCPDGWLKAGMRIPLSLTIRQDEYSRRAVGIARAVKNTLVSAHQMARAHGPGAWPSPMELEREFNSLKHDPEFGMRFVTEVSKFVAQGACRDFRRAYENWRNKELHARRSRREKKRRTGSGSFLAASGVAVVRYDGHRRIRLPGLGSVKLKRELPPGVIPYEVRIVRNNGQWYASVSHYAAPPAAESKTHAFGGADVGRNPLAVDADGEEFTHHENPKPLRNALSKLARWQRTQARRTPGSLGWWEAQRHIDKLQRRVKGLRDNAHHQVSRELVRKYAVLGIETLNVRGMDKQRNQALGIRDAAIGGLLSKIRYKAVWYGTQIAAAARSFPSSKLCSECGVVNGNLKREPRWVCPECGTAHDRNENAASNLREMARQAVGDLNALGAVGPDVTLPDGEALARSNQALGETAPCERRTGTESDVKKQLVFAF